MREDIFIKIEANRLGMRDVFSQLLATDNYIEKYLPIKVQNIVSLNLESFLFKNSY
jgi:hypothetical protein